jgi:hypothetical protein
MVAPIGVRNLCIVLISDLQGGISEGLLDGHSRHATFKVAQ